MSSPRRRSIELLCRRCLQQVRISGGACYGDEASVLAGLDAELAGCEASGLTAFEELCERGGLEAHSRELLLLLVTWALFPEIREVARSGRVSDGSPLVEEVVSLLGRSVPDRLDLRRCLAVGGPLERAGLVELSPSVPGACDLGRFSVQAAPHVIEWLVDGEVLPSWALRFAALLPPGPGLSDLALGPATAELAGRILQAWGDREGSLGTVVVAGPCGTGRTSLGRALAGRRAVIRVATPLLLAGSSPDTVGSRLEAIGRLARFHSARVLFDDADGLCGRDSANFPVMAAMMETPDRPALLVVEDADRLAPGIASRAAAVIHLLVPDPAQRKSLWAGVLPLLPDGAPPIASGDLDLLARKYAFTPAQIVHAVALARPHAGRVPGSAGAAEELEQAARTLLPPQLERLSMRVPGGLTLDDLVLPEEQRLALAEFLSACRHRLWVLENWGFARRIVRGHGVTALFDGESGTGKTVSAGILAAELGLPLYRVNLAQLVDKYVGETEKNIERVFAAAAAVQAILLFDEADALFTQRVQVGSSQDRFANLQTNALLQEVEHYDGISILTTNLGRNIDPAFIRRIQFRIRFPMPEPEERSLLWERLMPPQVPTDGSIDFDLLAERYEIAGGHIRNAVLRAAYRARELGTPVTMSLVEEAAAKECLAAGKLVRQITDD